MAICRINYLKYADMETINGLVKGAWIFAERNHVEQFEEYIQRAAEHIQGMFKDKVRAIDRVLIVQRLRALGRAVKNNSAAANQQNVDTVTSDIIKIVQGDKKMDKDQLVQEIHIRILDAMNKVESNATDGRGPGRPEVGDVSHDTAVRIVEDLLGGRAPAATEYVSKFYEMDPETEDVLHNGALLLDGMKVLIEDPNVREFPTDNMGPASINKARLRNRWCTVDQVKVENQQHNGPTVSFVGIYEDGIKRKTSLSVHYGWIVKKDSIPRVDVVLSGGPERISIFKGTIPQVLNFFKGGSQSELASLTVLLGGDDGFAVPGDQYAIVKGDVAEDVSHVLRKADLADTEVFDENGVSVLSGTVHDLLQWATSLPEESKYLDYRLRYAGTDKIVQVRDFLVKPVWDGKDRDNVYGVLGADNSLLHEGSKEEVLDFLDGAERPFLEASRVFYGEHFGSSIPAIDFVNNNTTEQGGDC